MYLHVVLLCIPRPDPEFISRLDALARDIAVLDADILEFRFVPNDSSRRGQFNFAFYSRFVSRAAHDRFQTLPEHDALKAYLMPGVSELVVLDSELDTS